MDAMDTDAPAAGLPVPEDNDFLFGSTSSAASRHEVPRHDGWNLLTLARQLIDEGNPSQALQAIVMAMRSDGGEQAVLDTLHRARERYRNKLQASAAADELASLFAECAIAEAQPIRSQPVPLPVAGPSVLLDANETSILAMTGRKQTVLDAFADGSSFVCLQCGGLVSSVRKDEHLAYWCSPI